jgi:deazaflavin-dependent oxidoreductase (nitroreductase family)
MGRPSKFYRRLIPLTLIPGSLPIDKALVQLIGYSFTNRIYSKAGGMRERPCLLMTTLHWKTGEPRTVVLPYHRFGDQFVVQGSKAGRPEDPVWATNVRAHPLTWLNVGGQKVFCRAHVAQGEERQRLWKEITADGAYLAYEKSAHPRIIPLVVNTPIDPTTVTKPDIDRATEAPDDAEGSASEPQQE